MFDKKNFISISASISILLVGFSIFYYIFFHLPKKDEEKNIQVRKEECRKIGNELHNQTIKQDPAIFGEPRFMYDVDSNNCYYFVVSISSAGGNTFVVYKTIKDAYTNIPVAYFNSINGESLEGKESEFENIYSNIFKN